MWNDARTDVRLLIKPNDLSLVLLLYTLNTPANTSLDINKNRHSNSHAVDGKLINKSKDVV